MTDEAFGQDACGMAFDYGVLLAELERARAGRSKARNLARKILTALIDRTDRPPSAGS